MKKKISNASNSILYLAVVLAVLAPIAFAAFRGQGRGNAQDKFDETQFPVVEEYALKTKTKEEQTKSEKKGKRFRLGVPIVSMSHWGVAAEVQHWPDDFSPLPVAESTTILVGEVTEANANLSDDRMAVYSDFIINAVAVLKDSCNVAKQNSVLTATRYGGRVKFQDGHTLLVFKSGLGMPRVGRRYLFFLKQTAADSDLLTAYEITNGKILPLDSGTPNFDMYKNANETDFIREVQQKIESLAKPSSTTEKTQ
jgi:hypothetical protein